MDVPKILNIGVWSGTSQLLPRSGTFEGSHDLALVQKSIFSTETEISQEYLGDM